MSRIRIHEEAKRMRFETYLWRQEKGEITQGEAAEYLGISERTFRRWTERYEDKGAAGLLDRRVGKPSGRRADDAEVERMLGLFRDKYADFTVKHFHEQLVKRHGYKLGYTVTKLRLQQAGLTHHARKRSAHRKKRARRTMQGMMVHQDGSRHMWLAGREDDLIVTMDDATSQIYSAFLVKEEGTASSFMGLIDVISRFGLFCEFYTDRGSHYFHTPDKGGKVSRTDLSQVTRALGQLGVTHIAAYSPQARGRSERMFRTLQDRLPKELALEGITTVEAANQWIAEVYIPQHNALFAVPAAEEGSAFVPDSMGAWREILCIRLERTVGNDNTVSWRTRHLQLPPGKLRPSYARAVVRVHEYPDGSIAVFHGPHRLADFDAGASTPTPIKLAA